MAIATQYGVGTISSTTAGPGDLPCVDVVSTLTHTTEYFDGFTMRSVVKDVEGDIGISATRLSDTTVRFSASRQLPAGEEIVFDWVTIDGVA